jgi:hypothetical protein
MNPPAYAGGFFLSVKSGLKFCETYQGLNNRWDFHWAGEDQGQVLEEQGKVNACPFLALVYASIGLRQRLNFPARDTPFGMLR